MKTQSKKWYWVLGDTKKGFKIVDKKPRTKFVPEPFANTNVNRMNKIINLT